MMYVIFLYSIHVPTGISEISIYRFYYDVYCFYCVIFIIDYRHLKLSSFFSFCLVLYMDKIVLVDQEMLENRTRGISCVALSKKKKRSSVI